ELRLTLACIGGLPHRGPTGQRDPKILPVVCRLGLAAAVSLQFLNSALQIGDLISVVPVISATPVFTMLLGLFVFRRERFSWRMAATLALVVPGVLLVALRDAQ